MKALRAQGRRVLVDQGDEDDSMVTEADLEDDNDNAAGLREVDDEFEPPVGLGASSSSDASWCAERFLGGKKGVRRKAH